MVFMVSEVLDNCMPWRESPPVETLMGIYWVWLWLEIRDYGISRFRLGCYLKPKTFKYSAWNQSQRGVHCHNRYNKQLLKLQTDIQLVRASLNPAPSRIVLEGTSTFQSGLTWPDPAVRDSD